MASYEQFAQIYDLALNELPYEEWLLYIEKIFEKYKTSPKLILDLGCGTGSMTNLMATKGYEMIGVDLSEDMLAVARDKAKEENSDVIYLNQDMTKLDLYGTIDAVISCGDALNYILDEGSVVVQNALNGLESPAALIGISEKGYVSLDLKVKLEQGGHSSMPPKTTAIGVLSHALSALDENPFPAKVDGPVGTMLNFLGPEMKFPFKTIFANRWLFGGILENQLANGTASNALIRTTTAPTIIQAGVKDNVLPSEANATINFRIIPGETPESVLSDVKDLIDDERVTVSLNDPNFAQAPGKLSPTDGFGFNVLSNTIREIFPETVVAPSLVIAATDARHYEACSDAIYRFMPVSLKKEELGMIHGINEKISVTSYEKLIQFYIRLLQNSTR